MHHNTLPYEHASKIDARLKAEVADMPGKAKVTDQAAKRTDVPGGVSRTQTDVPDGMQVPEPLSDAETAVEHPAARR
jgi:hypothetical protein